MVCSKCNKKIENNNTVCNCESKKSNTSKIILGILFLIVSFPINMFIIFSKLPSTDLEDPETMGGVFGRLASIYILVFIFSIIFYKIRKKKNSKNTSFIFISSVATMILIILNIFTQF